jgi:hypothetical protein
MIDRKEFCETISEIVVSGIANAPPGTLTLASVSIGALEFAPSLEGTRDAIADSEFAQASATSAMTLYCDWTLSSLNVLGNAFMDSFNTEVFGIHPTDPALPSLPADANFDEPGSSTGPTATVAALSDVAESAGDNAGSDEAGDSSDGSGLDGPGSDGADDVSSSTPAGDDHGGAADDARMSDDAGASVDPSSPSAASEDTADGSASDLSAQLSQDVHELGADSDSSYEQGSSGDNSYWGTFSDVYDSWSGGDWHSDSSSDSSSDHGSQSGGTDNGF